MLKAGRMGVMAIFLVMMAIAAPALASFSLYPSSNQLVYIFIIAVRLFMMYIIAASAESLFFDYHIRILNEIKPKTVLCFRRAGLFWKCASFFILILSFGISFLGYNIAIAVFAATFILMYFPTRGDYLYFTENEAYCLRDYSIMYTKITGYRDNGGVLRLYFNLGRHLDLALIPEGESSFDEAIRELAIRGVKKY